MALTVRVGGGIVFLVACKEVGGMVGVDGLVSLRVTKSEAALRDDD